MEKDEAVERDALRCEVANVLEVPPGEHGSAISFLYCLLPLGILNRQFHLALTSVRL